MKKATKITCTITVIALIIGMIFHFSNQNFSQSHGLSSQISYHIADTWIRSFRIYTTNPGDISFLANSLEPPIRKLAHLFIYNLLGFFGYFFLWKFDKKTNSFKKILLIQLLIIVVASLDEINQYYSSGRGSSIYDVFLDLFGGCIGIYIVFMLRDFKRHIQNGVSALKHKS